MDSGNPRVLTDAQMFHICAGVFEEHFGSIFVSSKDGRRLIADLRRRAGAEPPPTREDIDGDETHFVATSGEVVVRIPQPRPRDHQIREIDLLPNPVPGRVNIRLGVVDDTGMVAELELGNAPGALAEKVSTMLIDEHAAAQRKRETQTS